MVLLVVQFTTPDVPFVREAFVERDALRKSYGCSSARLMVSIEDPSALTVLFEFPSLDQARGYLDATTMAVGGAKLADIRDREIHFYEDLALS